MSKKFRYKKWFLAISLFGASLLCCQAQVYEVYDQDINLTKKINNEHILLIGEALRVSAKDQQLQLLNGRYEPFLKLEGASIHQYLTPWIIVKDKQQYGAYHEYGEQVLKTEYDHIETLYNQLLAQSGNNYFHYHHGTHEVQPIGTFQKAYLAENGQTIAINQLGEFQLPLSAQPHKAYTWLEPVSENTILSKEPTGYGLINRHGDYILDPIIDTLVHLEGDFFYAYNDHQHMLLKSGESSADIRYSSYHKITLEEDGAILEYIHGKLRRIMKNDGILLDITGMEKVSKIAPDHFNVFFKNNKVGLLNDKGIWEVIPAENIQKILPGKQGLFGALVDNKYGFVDRLGELKIENQYEAVGCFSEERAAIKNNGKWGYVNQDGEEIIPPIYDRAGEFRRGLAIVQQNGKSNLIDHMGQVKLAIGYQQIHYAEDHYFITLDNGVFGLVAPSGEEISCPKFDMIRREAPDKIIVQKDGLYGLLKESGDYALPIYYQNMMYEKSTKNILAEDIYFPPILIEDNKNKKKNKTKKGA